MSAVVSVIAASDFLIMVSVAGRSLIVISAALSVGTALTAVSGRSSVVCVPEAGTVVSALCGTCRGRISAAYDIGSYGTRNCLEFLVALLLVILGF